RANARHDRAACRSTQEAVQKPGPDPSPRRRLRCMCAFFHVFLRPRVDIDTYNIVSITTYKLVNVARRTKNRRTMAARRRRSADEARGLILDAAERRLREG